MGHYFPFLTEVGTVVRIKRALTLGHEKGLDWGGLFPKL